MTTVRSAPQLFFGQSAIKYYFLILIIIEGMYIPVNTNVKRRIFMELWKTIIIDDIETNYSVSSTGIVKNNTTGKILSQRIQQGYKHVTLSLGNGKQKGCRVHRLVAIAFIDNPDNKPFVNHIDCDRGNNNVENLEWVTQSENVAHAYRHGVEPRPTHQDQPFQKEILDIIENKKYFSIREASRQTGHKRDTIKRSLDLNTPVCNNTHHFIYVN